MAVTCPHCDLLINLNSPKPGRYRPRCPECDKPFSLAVPDDPAAAWTVRALASDTRTGDTLAPRRSGAVAVAGPAAVVHAGGWAAVAPPPAGSFTQARTNYDHRPTDPPPARRDPDPDDDHRPPPPAAVRGYAIQRELGRGGMGAVYLARQLSLDRAVALKVMSKRWAADPVFVARFTREAYAAAQLSHPNIVQIHDIGEADGARFFSMEYVPGQSLADLVREKGKVDPETAVGYVLQAARGLQHAHARGMIHRDVKPDNLLLDDDGLVKVADLGLVKTPATPRAHDALAGPASGLGSLPADMTGARIALGTPAYMSPEQCRDAAAVDHRADVYSLGCTLYVLVTGRPPFDGTTAVELMTKHAYEPIVPPERIVARLPREVSAVIQKMMSKDPADRFQTMAEVVRTLEAWLGVYHAGTFSPPEDQIDRLEGYVREFNTAGAAVLRGRAVKGFFTGALVGAVFLAFLGKVAWASGLVSLAGSAAAAYFVVDGVTRRGHLFGRTRQFVWGLSWKDWLVSAAAAGLFGVLLAMLGVFWIWVGFGLIGVGLAFALRHSLDRAADAARLPALDGCARLLRRMRAQGLGEDDLRQFVAKFGGRHWEAFFEALFGYEAKLAARALLLVRGGVAGPREKYAAWREPLLAWMDRTEKARKEARERTLLLAVEQARLLAAGSEAGAAHQKAERAADAMVRRASEFRREDVAGGPRPASLRAVVAAGSNPDFAVDVPAAGWGAWLVGLAVGPHVRAVLASVLLAACGLWAHQNGLVTGTGAAANLAAASGSADAAPPAGATRPLAVDGVPAEWTGWADSWNVGVAGLLLLGSLCYRGNLMAVLAVAGAGAAVAGPRAGVTAVGPLPASQVALLLGAVVALIGFRTGTR